MIQTTSMLPRLRMAIEAVAPIDGVSGSQGVIAVHFKPEATGPEQSAAQTVVTNFDWSQAAHDAWEADQTAKIIGPIRARRKTADQSFSTTAFADVADLEILLAPNANYEFEAYGAYTSAVAATGLQLSVTGPASPTLVRFIGEIAESVTAMRYGAGAAYDVAIAGAASAGATALPWGIRGSVSTGAVGGLLKVRARSETSGNAVTVLRGSILKTAATLE